MTHRKHSHAFGTITLTVTACLLRLGPLPKVESVKLAFACPVSLKADLDRYAALHAQVYGEAVDATTLIPHMLEAFMQGDRGFQRNSASKHALQNAGGVTISGCRTP